MKFAIIKERKNPPDKRVVLSPKACKKLTETFHDFQVKIESSDIRAFSDEEYSNEGLMVTDNVSDCDVFIGVKEVPIEALQPYKKYFFFSHTIKKQSYNRKLLQAILDKKIELYDHEVIVDKRNLRLIGFGRYAGIVGAYNGFRAYGLRFGLFELPKAETLEDQKALIEELSNMKMPTIKILLSGTGRVGRGAKEMLDALKIKEVTIEDFLYTEFDEPVYLQIDVLDYNKRKDGEIKDMQDFFANPQDYENDFMRFAKITDLYLAGHFWDKKAPVIISKEDAASDDFNIKVVADISCDVNGPLASTIRSSTIENPIYGYDPVTGKEVPYKTKGCITVMAVDNLPCELPKDASEGFGEMFTNYVIPAFFNNDKDGILARAVMTSNGKLTERFSYLQDYVDGKE